MSETHVVDEPDVDEAPKRSQRTALVVLGLIAAVVIGFALGIYLHPTADDTAASPAADSVDVGFAQDMTVHHSQAIDMASIALTNASDPLVKSLAFDILTTQQNQVGQMQGWLSLWNQPLLHSGGYMAWITDMSGMADMSGMQVGPVATMPGMATSTDIENLRKATGTGVDVLFLQLMLRHHEGGITMMQYAATHAQVPAVRNLAQTMVNTQGVEAAQMKQMLTEKGAQPLAQS